MESVHVKLIDPIGQSMLQKAARQGLSLLWERAEKLQPQDGFLRLGLSCPLDCMYGPCRIDPFGRGADKGICGLEKDEMVAASLLRLCQRGALEALAAIRQTDPPVRPQFPESLAHLADRAFDNFGLARFSADEHLDPALLPPSMSLDHEQLLAQAIRASLYCLAILSQSRHDGSPGPGLCRSGFNVMTGNGLRIGFSGKPSAEIVERLARQASSASEEIQLVALGTWLPLGSDFMSMASSSGTAELLLSSGSVHLLIAGAGTQPGLIQLCRTLNIPVVHDGGSDSADEILTSAANYHKLSGRSGLQDSPMPPNFTVYQRSSDLAQLLSENPERKICLVAGSDNPHITLGKLPQELYESLSGNGMMVCGWGDAAWWLTTSNPDSKNSAITTGPLVALQAIAECGDLNRLAGVCFTGLGSCLELAVTLGLAALGCRVFVATPIPIFGSNKVCEFLESKFQALGGDLYQVDPMPEVQDLVDWITK